MARDGDPTGKAALAAMERLENARALDAGVRAFDRLTAPVAKQGWTGSVLQGRWLGHTFHALLSDFVEGPWMAATFLDLFGPAGSEAAARRLLGLGLAVAPVAHLAGFADWQQSDRDGPRRVGVAHAAAVSTATALYAASYLARHRQRHGPAKVLGLAGGFIALFDGYLGGHLSHVRGVAVGEQT